MAKSIKVTWLGDEDPNQQAITEGGITFIKGMATPVPEDHTFNGHPWVDQFKGNPAFAVGTTSDEPVETEGELEALQAQLDTAGIEYPANATVETLRGKLPA